MKILIVEDEKRMAQALCQLLRLEKYEVDHCDNGLDGQYAIERKSNEYDVVIEINGGAITVFMGPGDTDCLDANGTIIVNGGTINLTGNSTFDADRGSVYNGGTIIINGTQVDSIPASMMGGHGGFGEGGGNKGDWQQGGKGGRPGGK